MGLGWALANNVKGTKELSNMKYEHDGMTIWSGTPDAPAPGEVVPVGKPVSITIGVRPQNASHEVKVLYRVNNSPDKPKALEAAWIRSDASGKGQYYRAEFPSFQPGDRVEYTPVCRCVDKQVPNPAEWPQESKGFAASFKVVPASELNKLEPKPAPSPVEIQRPGTTPPQAPVAPGNSKDDPSEPWLRIHGVVRTEHGEPLDGVTVQALNRDLRSEQLLGEVPAREGHYEIRYRRSQFRKAEKNSAALVMKVLGPEGNELYKTPIRYNAPGDLELDITLQGASYRGPSEWEVLTGALMPLLEDISPLELREDEQHQDISFLAGETGKSRLAIGTWIACFRLADKTAREETALPPEAFFGFLRQGQPSIFHDSFLQDMQHPDRMALMDDKILRGVAETTEDLQQSLLEKAIADNLIPSRTGLFIKEILETLRRIRLHYAAEITFGGGKGTIGQLLEITPAARQEQAAAQNESLQARESWKKTFMAAFTAYSGPIDGFWKKLVDDKVLGSDVVQQVKLSFELGALTLNHIPLVGELVNRFQSGDLKAKRELARYDRADWKRVFLRRGPDGQPIGVPSNIDGDTAEAKMEQFAAILEQQFERAYPTTSFAAKLGRTQQSPVEAKTDVARFLDNNPGFQLDRFRVEHYIAEHEEALQGIENRAALLTDLKSIQRVFKLKPTYQAVDALLSRKIDSAQQIYFMGQGQFTTAMADSGINKIEAKKLYRKAENVYATALALFGDYNLTMNGVTPYAVANTTPDPETQAKIAALPNLQTLFGSLDYCECTHCRSVYSPAAYFVDVMRYLGDRGTQGSAINAGKNVAQVLLDRRPDLGEIELSCENTNTPLPYIDLVNEILEDVVTPPTPVTLNAAIEPDLVAGPIRPSVLNDLKANAIAIGADAQVYAPDSRGQWTLRDAQHAYKLYKTDATLRLLPTRQTFLSAAELRANPEYTNQDAYGKLKQEVFPLNLPFDLWHLQARTYLSHLGVPQPRLLELFQQKLADDVTLSPSDLQIDCAWLGITETERKILTGVVPGKQPWDFWGLAETGNNIPDPENPAENITGRWVDVLSSVNVMLHRSGLAYKELLQLLDLHYVNPGGGIFIDDSTDPNAASCDTSKFTIRNLSAGRAQPHTPLHPPVAQAGLRDVGVRHAAARPESRPGHKRKTHHRCRAAGYLAHEPAARADRPGLAHHLQFV